MISNTKAQDAALDAAVFSAQVDLLFRERYDLIANGVVSLLLTVMVWGLYPPWLSISWLASLWIVLLGRASIRYHRSVSSRAPASARLAFRVYLAGTVVTGLLWGLAGSVVLVTPDPLHYVFIVFVVTGMACGAILRNAVSRWAMFGFIVPALVPMIVMLLTRANAPALDIGIMASIFALVMSASGLTINRTIVENIRSRIGRERSDVELRASEASTAEAQRLANVGGLEYVVAADEFVLTAEAFRVLGADPSTFVPSSASLVARVYPADRPAVRAAIERFFGNGEGHRLLEYRIVRDDGAVRFVESRGRKVEGPQGQPARLFASIQDVTERKTAANDLAYRDRLLDAVTAGTAILIQAESVELGMPEALQTVGEGMHLDFVEVVEEAPELASPVVLRTYWEARDVASHFNAASFMNPPTPPAAMTEIRAQLKAGEVVVGQRATGGGLLHTMLGRLHAESMLLVPIVLDHKLWGSMSVSVSRAARAWSATEIKTLKTFASIVGALALRDQHLESLATSEERFRVLLASAQDAIVTTDSVGRVLGWNRAAERIFGYTVQEALGRKFQEFMVPARLWKEAAGWLATFLAPADATVLGQTRERPVLRKDGTEVEVEASVASARLGNGIEAIGIFRDVTARKESERKLAFDDMLLRTEFEASPDGILVIDANRKLISVNQRFADMWGLSSYPLHEITEALAFRAGPSLLKYPSRFTDHIELLYAHQEASGDEEIEFLDGRFVDVRTPVLKSRDGAYLGRVWYCRDISKRKQAETLAIQMAHFDVLTGLSNRSVFVEKVAQAIADAGRDKRGFAVLYMDLDHFKDVNDTLGHPAGDGLLREVAGRLRSHVPAGDPIARFGGDEFAVLVSDVDDPAVAGFTAANLLAALAAPFTVGGFEIRSGASIGIDLYGPESNEPEALLKHADVALYRAKSEGRGGYRFFTDAMDLEVRTRVTLGSELRTAIEGDQLFLLYQPQVAIETGRIVGLEALVRWHHPERGILSPDLFIPVAESTGGITALGRWVLFAACRQARSWLDAGISPVRIAVNVSGRQFEAPLELEGEIATALAESRLPPRLLEIELTETVLMGVAQTYGESLARLRETGVQLAIDDFGTGYSSLGYLGRFPVDRIKIPREFVKDITTVPGQAAVARAAIGLAHDFGIAVIAEGVETREQLEALRALGCPEIQGYYFSKPLSVEALTLVFTSGGILTPST